MMDTMTSGSGSGNNSSGISKIKQEKVEKCDVDSERRFNCGIFIRFTMRLNRAFDDV